MIIKKISYLAPTIVAINLIASIPANATSLALNPQPDSNSSGFLPEPVTRYEMEDQLLAEVKSTINELNEATTVTQVIIDDREVYMYNYPSTNSATANIPIPTSEVYTNIWTAPGLPQRKKVPEASSLLGLIAVGALLFVVNQINRQTVE
jgi:hypothetical protein